MVPIDESFQSGRVFPWVRMFLESPDTRVSIVHVSPIRGAEGGSPRDCRRYMAEVATKFETWKDRIDAHIDVGRPATKILELARLHGSDLILMPTRARTGIARALFGSVAAEVVQGADTPVMLLGPAAPRRIRICSWTRSVEILAI